MLPVRPAHHVGFQMQAKLLVTPEASQGKAAAEITQLAASTSGSHMAAGHADGTIRIWDSDTGGCEVWRPDSPLALHTWDARVTCCTPPNTADAVLAHLQRLCTVLAA